MLDRREDLEFGYDVYDENDLKRYVWWLKGPSGGVHIWGQECGELSYFGENFYGGIEVHYKSKPYEFSPDEAPIKGCWLTGCDCWPEGSSLYFSERLLPFVEGHHKGYNCDSFMESELLRWYEDNFGIAHRDEELTDD